MTEMKPKKQLAHLFNATRCIGCTACMNACAQTNYGDVMASGKPIHGRVMPGNIQKIVMDGNRRPFQIMSQCQQCSARTRPASRRVRSARITGIRKRAR